jgi:hypothetical protein
VFRFRQYVVVTVTLLLLATAQVPTAVAPTGSPSGDTMTLVVAGLAVLAVAALAGARYAAGVIRSPEITVGGRAREHRQVLGMMPAPQHPATAGRPRPRAPSQSIAVA